METFVGLDGDQRLLVNVDEAARRLSISHKQIYRLMTNGDLGSVHLGKRRLIPVDELRRYVKRLVDQAA